MRGWAARHRVDAKFALGLRLHLRHIDMATAQSMAIRMQTLFRGRRARVAAIELVRGVSRFQ